MLNALKFVTSKAVLQVVAAIFFVVFSHNSYSQKNEQVGFIVQNDLDTLKGYVSFEKNKNNPGQIRFRESTSQDQIILFPKDIKSFGAGEQIYISANTEIEVSARENSFLDADRNLKLKNVEVFLLFLVKGTKDLLFYRDANGNENFYIGYGNTIELLGYKRYLDYQNGLELIGENQRFIGQLNIHFADCSTISKRVETARYQMTYLINLFEKYHQCTTVDPNYKNETFDFKIDFGAIAGISTMSMKIKGPEQFDYVKEMNFGRSTNASFGAFANLNRISKTNKLSYQAEVLFTKYNDAVAFIKSDTTDYAPNSSFEYMIVERRDVEASIDYSFLKFNNLLQYNYSIRDIQLIFNAGLSIGMVFESKNHSQRIESTSIYISEDERYSEELIVQPAIPFTKGTELGWFVGSGIGYNRFAIQLRYENGDGMINHKKLNSITGRYYFLLFVRF